MIMEERMGKGPPRRDHPGFPPPIPGMPPIADTKDSRLRFLDLDPLLAEIRGPEGTAWVPESARVLRSGAYQFLDEPYIEQVIVAKYGCPEMYDNGLHFGGQNVSIFEIFKTLLRSSVRSCRRSILRSIPH